MLKPSFFCSIFLTVVISSSAQWESHSSGFAMQRGINQIVATSDSVIWATAYNSFVVFNPCRDYCKSTDGGNTWTASAITSAPLTTLWSCIAALDANTAWALLINNPPPAGNVWKTTDGGITWAQEGAGTMYVDDASFPDVIYFWDANQGVVVGDPVNGEFEIYTTDDGGTTWTPVDGVNIPDPLPGEYALSACLAVYKNIIWFGTGKGRIYKSTDRGLTWKVFDTGFNQYTLFSIAYENEDTGWVVAVDTGFKGLYRTTDGSVTWTNITPSGKFYVSYMCYVPNTHSILVSSGHHPDNLSVFGSSYSPDGGDTWVDIDDSVKHQAVDFFDDATGWSGDVNTDSKTGGMWRYTGTVLTGISGLPPGSSFKLYPNPSSGLFYFSFKTDNYRPVHLIVTNPEGKIIFDQTYKDVSQTWLRSIDLRHFAKGIYFLTVGNNDNRFSQKIVIQ